MFAYFGYGSNINLLALKAKGVEPVSSSPGMLRGWRLKFNVQHWFRHEGGMGNIQQDETGSDQVEGMLHFCRDEHLLPLDKLEAYGIGYDRIRVEVETDQGRFEAYTYVGLPDFIDESCLPTRRYLNIIISGAEEAGLSEAYIERLRRHPIHVPDDYPEFRAPKEPLITFSEATLSSYPYLTALAGSVFDMRGCRKQLECLIDLFGGKDMTLFHLKRHDSSDGNETLRDYVEGNISEGGRQYLNAYLHEYTREFTYAGSFDYGVIMNQRN